MGKLSKQKLSDEFFRYRIRRYNLTLFVLMPGLLFLFSIVFTFGSLNMFSLLLPLFLLALYPVYKKYLPATFHSKLHEREDLRKYAYDYTFPRMLTDKDFEKKVLLAIFAFFAVLLVILEVIVSRLF